MDWFEVNCDAPLGLVIAVVLSIPAPAVVSAAVARSESVNELRVIPGATTCSGIALSPMMLLASVVTAPLFADPLPAGCATVKDSASAGFGTLPALEAGPASGQNSTPLIAPPLIVQVPPETNAPMNCAPAGTLAEVAVQPVLPFGDVV